MAGQGIGLCSGKARMNGKEREYVLKYFSKYQSRPIKGYREFMEGEKIRAGGRR